MNELIKNYNEELYHYGIKGMKWGVRRYQNKDGTLTAAGKKHVTNKEIRQDKQRKQDELSNKYYNQSKGAKYYDEAIKILEKWDLDGDDGGGGKPNTPDSARQKYLDLMEKANDAYNEERIAQRAKIDTGKYLVEKYGQERIDSFNRAETVRGAAVTAGVLTAVGTVYIGVPILAIKGTKAVGKGAINLVKKAIK